MKDWRQAVLDAANHPELASETVYELAFMKLNCSGYGWDIIGDTRAALHEINERLYPNVDGLAALRIHAAFQLMYQAVLDAKEERT